MAIPLQASGRATKFAGMTTVRSDAELHSAINDGAREVDADPNEDFELLRTLGLARPRWRDPEVEVLDLIAVGAEGAQAYVAANAVVAGLWASGRGLLRSHVHAVMGERVLDVRATSLAVCNGQFAAPARWIAPRAHPADGRLAVLIDGNRRWRGRALMARMARGDHVPDRRIHQLRPLTLAVAGPRWPLTADGIADRGRLPATFRILPGALRLTV